jgi:hypothetical protein
MHPIEWMNREHITKQFLMSHVLVTKDGVRIGSWIY